MHCRDKHDDKVRGQCNLIASLVIATGHNFLLVYLLVQLLEDAAKVTKLSFRIRVINLCTVTIATMCNVSFRGPVIILYTGTIATMCNSTPAQPETHEDDEAGNGAQAPPLMTTASTAF